MSRLTRYRQTADRADRIVGRLYLRAVGTLFLLVGLIALGTALAADNFSVRTYGPVLIGAGAFLLVARFCYRSRAGMSEIFDDTPQPPR